MVGKQIRITGVVQGVGYRYFAKIQADALGIRGWTQNMEDSSVHIVAVGDERSISQYLLKLKVGPPRAKVEGLDVRDVEISENQLQNEFEIRRV